MTWDGRGRLSGVRFVIATEHGNVPIRLVAQVDRAPRGGAPGGRRPPHLVVTPVARAHEIIREELSQYWARQSQIIVERLVKSPRPD